MIPVPLSMLVRQADAILWVRKAAGDAGSAGESYAVVEVLGGGAPPAPSETEVRIVPGDYDSLAGVHEPPIPGMHVSPAYRYYPGQARGDEPEGCIVFLRRHRLGDSVVLVSAVQGAREPVSKRAEILALLAGSGLLAARGPGPERAAAPRRSLWARLFRRG